MKQFRKNSPFICKYKHFKFCAQCGLVFFRLEIWGFLVGLFRLLIPHQPDTLKSVPLTLKRDGRPTFPAYGKMATPLC